jgi:hypothetical protein
MTLEKCLPVELFYPTTSSEKVASEEVNVKPVVSSASRKVYLKVYL